MKYFLLIIVLTLTQQMSSAFAGDVAIKEILTREDQIANMTKQEAAAAGVDKHEWANAQMHHRMEWQQARIQGLTVEEFRLKRSKEIGERQMVEDARMRRDAKNLPRVVLMPIRLDAKDPELQGPMEAALAEGLQTLNTVIWGPKVAMKANEVFHAESRKGVVCDEIKCLQKVSGAFQSEQIAVASVTKNASGYYLAVTVSNAYDSSVLMTKAYQCTGCGMVQIISAFKNVYAGGFDHPVGSDGKIVETQAMRDARAKEVIEHPPTMYINGLPISERPAYSN